MNAPAAAARAERELPPLSPMAMRIIAQAQDPDTGASDLARLVELDAAATVALLRLVNSPFYGMPRQVGTVTDAIMVLGLTTVRRVVLAIALRQPLSAARLDRELVRTIWRESVNVAALANRLLDGGGAGDLAFTAGVLHDLGRLALQLDDPPVYAPLMGMEAAELLIRERAAFGTDHALRGAELLQRWGLPEIICDAVRQHHADAHAPPAEPAAQGLWMACRMTEAALPPQFWRQLPHIVVDPQRALESTRQEVQALTSLMNG